MVVRSGEVGGSAFVDPRSWHKGVTRALRDLARLPSAQSAVANARSAATSLTGARLHREAVDRYLATHAVTTGRRPV